MRFIHTADWHLGRLMYGARLTDDQAHVLDQLTLLARETKPDVLVISGDVYDRAVPPPDAVELLGSFLSRMVVDLKVPVILIAGNHDGPHRLEFASRVLAGRGLHVLGTIRAEVTRITIADDAGPVHFFALPYAEPALVREKMECAEAKDHEQAMQVLMDRVRERGTPGERSVVVAHAFVAGGEAAESERPLSVGGAEQVDCAHFAGFQYAALGHLHRQQWVGQPHIRYAGSLLKYSFSEADHKKVVNVVEMDEHGQCRVESVALTPRREVRRITGYLANVLAGPASGENREDYLEVTLLDTGALLDVMGKLRDVYPNVLHVERPGFGPSARSSSRSSDPRKLNNADLFAAFFSEVTGEPLSPDQTAAYESAVEDLQTQDREAVVS